MAAARLVDRGFLERDPEAVAPELLNLVLACGDRKARIVEVEAYAGERDPASHAHRGPTPRTELMFGRPGHLYVYLSYGVHWCANVVAHGPDVAGAVLIRAVEPLTGIDAMRAARPAARRDVDLSNGPGKVCQAMGIGPEHLGVDLCDRRSAVRLLDDGTPPPDRPTVGPRVGITKAIEVPWRFSVPDHPHRSKPWR